MSTVVLREFLISLGFKVDRTSTVDFERTIKDSTAKLMALAAAAEAAAMAVIAATTKMASGLEQLYFSAQRVGASAESMKAFGYAASQMGSSVDDAVSSIEALAQRLRTNPGYGALANSLLGGKANLQDSSVLAAQLTERFRSMPYYLANAYAQAFGISETTLRAMLAGFGKFDEDYRRKVTVFGVDLQKATESGRAFMISVRQVAASIELLSTKIGAGMADRLAASFKRFDAYLEQNADLITRVLTRMLDIVMRVADLITNALFRVGDAVLAIRDWFYKLSPAAQEMVTRLGELIVVWRLLNTAFLASPIGRIMALAAAILLLWEDYQVWKAGGESLIDWKKWEPAILKALEALDKIGTALKEHGPSIEGWTKLFEVMLVFVAGKWVVGMLGAITRVGMSLAALTAPRWLLFMLGRLAGPAALAWGLFVPDNETPDDASELGELRRALSAAADVTADRQLPPEARALLDTIAGPESGGRYDVRWGGTGKPDATFSDMSKHPRIYEPGPAGPSSAAGRYQLTAQTYDEFAPQVGVNDFSPASQDRVAWQVAVQTYRAQTGRDLLTDLRAGSTDPTRRAAIERALKGRWAGINLSPFQSNLAIERNKGDAFPPYDPMLRTGQAPAWDAALSATRLSEGAMAAPYVSMMNTFNINGAGDPMAVGGAVASQQQRVNADLTRNLQRGIR